MRILTVRQPWAWAIIHGDAHRVAGQGPQEREKLLAEILGQGGDSE